MSKDNFHFIGIGGIGMSGLARMLLEKKERVSGSDLSSNRNTEDLKRHGAHIYQGHQASNVQEASTIIYSTAIDESNPEIAEAKKIGCSLWHRSDLLAHLMKPYDSIAVAGTHGKTSTSALLSHTLLVSKKSPSFVIGGILMPQELNASSGKGKYFVAEADESDQSFLKYYPNFAIITNVEADHLDRYDNFDHIENSFQQFITQVQDEIFWCYDCPNLQKMNPKGTSYGFHPSADICILNAKQVGLNSQFDLKIQSKVYSKIKLSMIGEHNILNAAAVFGLCLKLGIKKQALYEAFASFEGVKRRAEKVAEVQKIQIYDDYAHHPTEVECMLKSFSKAFPKRRKIALFEPHRFSRLKAFEQEFANSFKAADEVWLTDVFNAGEKDNLGIDLLKLKDQIQKCSQTTCHYVPKDEILTFAKKHLLPFDVLITTGAGSITQYGPKIANELQKAPPRIKLGLISGSVSCEHYVSLISSRFIFENYDSNLYELTVFKIEKDGTWSLCDQSFDRLKALSKLDAIKMLIDCDVIVPILHGRGGEDGMIQGFLQSLDLPCCGTSYAMSSFNMNKIWMKMFAKSLGVKVPKGLYFHQEEWQESASFCLDEIDNKLSFPLVVKPAHLGSTIGVHFVREKKELSEAIENVFELDESLVIEEQIIGRELEVSCFETEEGLVVTHPGEVKSHVRCYDYVAKYSKDPIEKVVYADVPANISKKCRQIAQKIYQKMQIRSYARIDFFLTEENALIFAEVNTLPGMTPRSLFQRTLMHSGIGADQIVHEMIIDAMDRHRKEIRKSKQVQNFLESVEDVTHKR